MATFPEPYRLANETLKRLNRKTSRRAEKLKRELLQLGFDDLNVMKSLQKFYGGMDRECRKEFRKLYRDRYDELWLWLKDEEQEDDIIEDLIDMKLSDILFWPNKLTHYVWTTETIRKRDRAVEAIQAAPTRLQKQLELDKAIRYLAQQMAFYVDIVSQDAEEEAYREAGVKKVRWMVYGDDRVCETCEGLNGTVWDIDHIPDRPHPRCRCYLRPVT